MAKQLKKIIIPTVIKNKNLFIVPCYLLKFCSVECWIAHHSADRQGREDFYLNTEVECSASQK